MGHSENGGWARRPRTGGKTEERLQPLRAGNFPRRDAVFPLKPVAPRLGRSRLPLGRLQGLTPGDGVGLGRGRQPGSLSSHKS